MDNNPDGQPNGSGLSRRLSLRGVIQLVVGVTALALVLLRADPRGLAEALKATRLAYLPLAVAASFTVTWLMAYRWGLILRVRTEVRTARLFAYYLIGIFFMNFVPGGGVSGDVARMIYAARDVRDRAFVLSSLVYERLVGLFTLLLVGVVATLLERATAGTERVIYAGEIVLAAGFAAASLLMSGYVSSRLARLARSTGARLNAERAGAAVARTFEALSELKRRRGMLVSTFLVSVLIRAVWSLGCYVIALAMNLPLSAATVFAFISLVDLIRMLPISINGLGVREWMMVVLFAGIGLRREQALMFSFLAFAPIVLNAVVGGIVYTSRSALVERALGSEV